MVVVARGEVDMHIPLRLAFCATLCMQAAVKLSREVALCIFSDS